MSPPANLLHAFCCILTLTASGLGGGDFEDILEVNKSVPTTDCMCTFDDDAKELRCTNISGLGVLTQLLETPRSWCFNNTSVTSQLEANSNSEDHRRRVRKLLVFDSRVADFSFDSLRLFDILEVVVMSNNDFEESRLGATANDLRLVTVVELDLRNNELTRLPARFLATFPSLQVIRMDKNNLSKLEDGFFSQDIVPDLRNISMKDNPWICAHMWWFIHWIRNNSSPRLEDSEMIECLPCEEHQNYSCNYKKLSFDNFVNRCPVNCTCTTTRGIVDVDCRNKGYYDFPPELPKMLRILHMENNFIRSIQTLRNMSHLYPKVRRLYLDNNFIDSMNELDGIKLEELAALYFAGNRLRQLSVHALKKLFSHGLHEVKLGNNPWNCECNTVVPFLDLLNSRSKNFKDIEEVRCSSNSTLYPNKAIYRLTAADFCSEQSYIHPLDIINVVLATLIFLIVAKLVYDHRTFKRTGRIPSCPYHYINSF